MLKKYSSDIEAIKMDFRFFIHELTKKEKIKPYFTILFVGFSSSREKVLVLI